MIDDFALGAEDAVGKPIVSDELPDLDGFYSGHLAGSGMSVMFVGTISRSERCHPAWSTSSTACAPGATAVAISAKCRFMVATLQRGSTRPAPLPSLGQIAPKM
jgi:hypothetical protein